MKKMSTGDYVNYVILFLFAFMCVFPFLYVMSVSLSDPETYVPLRFILVPKKLSLASYRFILKTDAFVSSFVNSVTVTAVGTILNLIVTFTGAFGLAKTRMPGCKLMLSLITFTLVFNAGIVPNYILMKNLKLLNSYWALILPGLTNAWSLIVVRNFMVAIPTELEEAAQIDGCNDLSSFVRIILPLSMASIATFALFFAVGHWNAYFNTMLYITDSRKWTLPVLVKTMVMDSSGTGYGAATSISSDTKAVPQDTIKMSAIVLSMLPILVLYPFLQKYFVKGVMIGAVKG